MIIRRRRRKARIKDYVALYHNPRALFGRNIAVKLWHEGKDVIRVEHDGTAYDICAFVSDGQLKVRIIRGPGD